MGTRLAGLVRRFCDERRGMGAVEFALVAPVLLVLVLGGTEMSLALTVKRKVQGVAGTVNDLASQSTSLTEAELRALFRLATASLAPYPVSPLTLKTIAVEIDATGKATVDWACGSTGVTLPRHGDAVPLPAALSTLRSTWIMSTEAHYAYSPVTAQVFTGSVDLAGTSYVTPRYSSRIDAPGCSDAPL